ncbi:MAG: hypothetical protein ACLP0J_02775 [Solirubrobacteraceae bacterium]
MKRYRSVVVGIAVAVLALVAAAGAAAQTSGPPPPINDNYLDSLELNAPGAKLNSVDTLKDVRDTTNATVQPNIFSPCGQSTCPVGPAEITTCDGVSYGNTVWYDFYPNANGSVQIQTSGFDNAISLYTFNTNTLLPTLQRCVHQSDFPSETLFANVKKRVAYTIQIGGVNDAAGPLEFLFDYFIPPPPRLTATATITATTSDGGLELLNLTVATSRGTHVEVNCGDRCRPEAENVANFGSTTVQFPHLKGVVMSPGSKLQIRVSAPGSIGTLIQYTFSPDGATKQVFCMEPGTRTPRTTCH